MMPGIYNNVVDINVVEHWSIVILIIFTSQNNEVIAEYSIKYVKINT